MRLPENWSKARVTLGIVAISAAAWIIASLMHLDGWVTVWGGFWPGPARYLYSDSGGVFLPLWLTPLTATLIHAGILHLIFNMIMLAFCGRPVESVLGPWSLAILYVLGAYAAAGGQYLVDPVSTSPMVGASGAISAVIGAYAMLFGRNKVKLANPTLALWVNALWLMAAWVVLQICLGIALAGPDFLGSGEGVQVAVAAHIGGFLVGLVLANPLLLFRYRRA